MRRSWSKEAVLSALKERKAEGLSLLRGDVVNEDRSLHWAACAYFGQDGYTKALKKIGVRVVRLQKTWSKEVLVKEICRIWKKTGKINSNFVQVHHAPLYQSAVRYFGSWGKAVKAAGFSYRTVRVRKPFRKWSKKAIIAEIEKRKNKGLLRRGSIGTLDDRGLYHAAVRYFGKGGWKKACGKAGLKTLPAPKRIRWTGKLVFQEIRILRQKRERLPSTFLETHGYWALIKAARRLFGSWKNALIKAGLNYKEVGPVRSRRWTQNTVVAEIKRLDRLGVRLNHKAIRETRCDLLGGAINRFGSWCQAVTAAGINYREHTLIWSTKAWLRQLNEEDIVELKQQAENLSTKRVRK